MQKRRGLFIGTVLSAALAFAFVLCGCGKESVPEETPVPLAAYAYSDIAGEYEGELTPGGYTLTGDWEGYLAAMGQNKEAFDKAMADVFSEYDGVACSVTATLSADTLSLTSRSDVFFGSTVLKLSDFVLTDGKASGECQRAQNKSDGKVVYDVTLLAADGGGYRLVGTATVSEWADFTLGEGTTELGYSCTAFFDMALTGK